MGYNRHEQYDANKPPKHEAITAAKKHEYISGEHTSNRRRETPATRRAFMFNAYIDLAIGKLTHYTDQVSGERFKFEHSATIFTMGHTQISDIVKMSVGSVFSYMNTRAILMACAIEWAKKNVHGNDEDSRAAALIIIAQYAAAWPKQAKKAGFVFGLVE
jgi:hypothetical protein